jgi:hypothetical protein
MKLIEKLIPQPQAIKMKQELTSAHKFNFCRIGGIMEDTLKEIKRAFPQMKFYKGGEPFSAVISSSERAKVRLPSLNVPKKRGAYVLEIDKNSVYLKGYDAAGVWHAFQTLLQLFRFSDSEDGKLPVTQIVDYPAVELRGIHLDIKGYQPKLDIIMDELRVLASYKINCVLLEIEDKLQYETTPEVARPGAFTKSDLARIGKLCNALHIELIPKVQSLGHMDYLLKYKRYAALRENNHPYQYCPSNPESFKLWKGLCDEVINVLPYSRYFHIGADETMYLGECPTCRRYSKADLYINHIKKCTNHLKTKGKVPIMWDDLLRNQHGILGEEGSYKALELGKEAVLMYWAYGYGGQNNVFPYLPSYLANGLEIWGASGFSGCGPSWIQNIPPYQDRVLNIDAWTQAAVVNNLKAVMCTGWGRIASADPPAEPFELCWLPMLYSTESTWHGAPLDPDRFAARFVDNFFGMKDEKWGKLFCHVDKEYQPSLSEIKVKGCNAARFQLFIQLNRLYNHNLNRNLLLEILQMYRTPLMAKALADYRIDMVKKRATAFEKERASFMNEIKQVLSKFYTADTVNSFMESRFGVDAEIVDKLNSLLKKQIEK